MTPLAWALVAYMALQFVVTLLVARIIKTESDYLLAGRRLGAWLAAMSIFATWFGAETVMASSGAVAAGGLSDTRAEPFGYAISLTLMGLLLASRLRAHGFTTGADLYAHRFSKRAGVLAAIIMIPTSLIWAGAQIMAFAVVLSATFGISFGLALGVGTLFVIVYTSLSGLLGDVITDNIEGVIVVIGLVVLLSLVIDARGGASAAYTAIDPARLGLLKDGETWANQLNQWAIPIIGSLVAQEIISRMLATTDPQTARRACLGGAGIYLCVGLIPVTLGLIGSGLVPPQEEADHFLPTLAATMMPPALHVIFLGALISAILSTINSSLLSIAALAGHNLLRPYRPHVPDRTWLRIDRMLVVAAGLAAMGVAVAGDSIYSLLQLASSFGSAGLVIVMIFGLWSRIGGPAAAVAAMATGVIMTILGEYVVHWENAYLMALGACLVVFLGVSGLEKLAAASRQGPRTAL